LENLNDDYIYQCGILVIINKLILNFFYPQPSILTGFFLFNIQLIPTYTIFIKKNDMEKLTNPRHKEIYRILMEDIKKNPSGYSTLTNNEIYELMDFKVSPFSIRDHIIKLANKRVIQKVNNTWIDDNYHPRVIYMGTNNVVG